MEKWKNEKKRTFTVFGEGLMQNLDVFPLMLGKQTHLGAEKKLREESFECSEIIKIIIIVIIEFLEFCYVKLSF